MNAATYDSIRPEATIPFRGLLATLRAKLRRAFELAGEPYATTGSYHL
ncbi:MAG: hypothetical protein ACRYGO_12540 [Janthinobacterium lividum]